MQDESKKAGLTLEVALYGLLGLLALLSRFYALGRHPLTAAEATQALHAWQSVSGPGGDALAASPLLFAGQSLAFALFGASDGAARLLPALAGAALVLLPYLLRHRLGRTGALAASALLLISPTVLFASRHGGGDVLLLAAGLAALVGILGWVDHRHPKYLYLTAVSAALALIAGPNVFTLAVALGLGLALLAFLDRRAGLDAGWTALRAAWLEARRHPAAMRAGLALFLGVLLLGPTVFLLRLEGLQAVADLPVRWLNHFAGWAGEQPWSYPLSTLLLYEPATLLFGVVGAVEAFRRRDELELCLVGWAAAALIVAFLAGGRGPGDLLLVVGPLTLPAGKAIGRLLETVADEGRWAQGGLIVALEMAVAVFFYVELASYAYRRETSFLWLALLSLGLFAGLFALYAVWAGRRAAWRGAGLVALALLILITASASFKLAYRRAHDPRELPVVEGTSPNVRDLPAVLERASMQRLGATEVIPITIDEAVGPVVRWYLRNFRHQAWRAGDLGPEVTTEAAVTPWKPYPPALGAAYFGKDFAVATSWQPGNMTWVDWANWLLYRRSPDRPQEERVVLWLRETE
jgi:uncharacterized protein (TIGR03663 family)